MCVTKYCADKLDFKHKCMSSGKSTNMGFSSPNLGICFHLKIVLKFVIEVTTSKFMFSKISQKKKKEKEKKKERD